MFTQGVSHNILISNFSRQRSFGHILEVRGMSQRFGNVMRVIWKYQNQFGTSSTGKLLPLCKRLAFKFGEKEREILNLISVYHRSGDMQIRHQEAFE